jgi:GWxTD domain-containing protein
MNLKLFLMLMLFTFAFGGCASVPKSFKEATLDDMYPILTVEQFQVLDSLNSNEEINTFLDEYWKSMDSTSSLQEDEFKDEYLKRVAYANDHCHDRRGWGRSDRKRIYVTHGPPSFIDRQEYVNFKLGEFSAAKSVEIWLYMTPGKNDAFPSKGDGIYTGAK